MDYYGIPNPWPIAKDKFGIPDWFVDLTITDHWIDFHDEITIDPEMTQILIEKSYSHEDGKCYEIQEYVIYDYEVTTRYGTLQNILHVDLEELHQARKSAILFLTKQLQGSLASYADPSLSTAGGLIDVGIAFAGLPIAQIFGDIGQGISLGQLLDEASELVDKIEPILKAIERLIAADGKVVAEYADVVWSYNWKQIKTYSSVQDIIEVECARWIQEIPEGEVKRVPMWDEWVYPPLVPDDSLEQEINKIKEESRNVKSMATGTIDQMIKEITENNRTRKK